MIKSINTPSALITVSAPGGLEHLALWAQCCGVLANQKLQEIVFLLRVFLKEAWVQQRQIKAKEDRGNEEDKVNGS